MAANPRSKLIHKLMTLGKKIANERAFRERQRFGELLAGPSLEHSREQHHLPIFALRRCCISRRLLKCPTQPAHDAAMLRYGQPAVGLEETRPSEVPGMIQ